MYIAIALQAVALSGLYTTGFFLYNSHEKIGEFLVSTSSTPTSKPTASSTPETFSCEFQGYTDNSCKIFVIEKSSSEGFGMKDFKASDKEANSQDFYNNAFFKLRLNVNWLPYIDLSKKNLTIGLKNAASNAVTDFKFHALFLENRFDAYVNYFLAKAVNGDTTTAADFGQNNSNNKFKCTIKGISEIEINEPKTCIVNMVGQVKAIKTHGAFEKTEQIEQAMKDSKVSPLPSINAVKKETFSTDQLFILKVSNKFWKSVIQKSNSPLNFDVTISNVSVTNPTTTNSTKTFTLSNIRGISVIEKSDEEKSKTRIIDPEQTQIKSIFWI